MKTQSPTIPHIFDFAPQEIYWRWHRKERIIENSDGKPAFKFVPWSIALSIEYWIIYPYLNKGEVRKISPAKSIRHHGIWKRFTDILQTGSLSKLTVKDEKELLLALRALRYGLFNGGEKGSGIPQLEGRAVRNDWIWKYVTAYIKPETTEERARLWSMVSQL